MVGVEIVSGEIIFKMSGSGNDFIFIDGRASPLVRWPPDRIRDVCTHGSGVGADGLIVLEPGSAPGHVGFTFFNSDGARAGMCGNGALCATRLAAWLELAPGDGMVLETDAGPVPARCLDGEGEQAEIEIPVPTTLSNPDIELGPGERSMWFTTVGVPHLVVLVEDLDRVALEERGRELRSHPGIGAEGANVNFVVNGGTWLGMRTYERGVEAETLACGTGALQHSDQWSGGSRRASARSGRRSRGRQPHGHGASNHRFPGNQSRISVGGDCRPVSRWYGLEHHCRSG